MELFFHEANSEEFRNSILSIEHPTAQKVIDSEYFVQAYCLIKALKIIIEKENINILDYDELNNFLSDFFGSDNIEYLIKMAIICVANIWEMLRMILDLK